MKATLPDGTLFEGTPEEFNAIHRPFDTTSQGHKPTTTANNGSSQIWNEKIARAFWNSLDRRHKGGAQKKLLQYLIKRGGSAPLDDVKKHLNVQSGQELAGVLANISRNVRRETGYKQFLAVEWSPGENGGSYCLPEEVLKVLKQLE